MEHVDVAEIRTGCRVAAVRRTRDAFGLELAGGGRLSARAVVAASGTFGQPHRPALPGLAEFTGQVLRAAEYRSPVPFAGRRVVVVGAGNSAVQIAVELAATARVTLATRAPVKFAAQRLLGRDLHLWTTRTGLDAAGDPRHREGIATGVRGLVFVGLEWQRGLSSNSLCGVGRDADRVARRLAAGLARR
ncbi:NAD(P)-binding domain-containing protein [Streptomyces sp. NPDC057249]|uniref:NAD(P)-binding domain-containing protein n=1 Tax=Streptomyces sp. NPDC057249 TaxID=3346067 RepID=UPI003626A23D